MAFHFKISAGIGAAMLLAACGGGDGASGGKVNEKTFAATCETNSNMPAEICACVADKAMSELSEDGRAFLIAGLEEDQARATELREKMKPEELMATSMFLVNTPAACAQEQNG